MGRGRLCIERRPNRCGIVGNGEGYLPAEDLFSVGEADRLEQAFRYLVHHHVERDIAEIILPNEFELALGLVKARNAELGHEQDHARLRKQMERPIRPVLGKVDENGLDLARAEIEERQRVIGRQHVERKHLFRRSDVMKPAGMERQCRVQELGIESVRLHARWNRLAPRERGGRYDWTELDRAMDLLRGSGPGLPEGITYVGQATVPAASVRNGAMVLTFLVGVPAAKRSRNQLSMIWRERASLRSS